MLTNYGQHLRIRRDGWESWSRRELNSRVGILSSDMLHAYVTVCLRESTCQVVPTTTAIVLSIIRLGVQAYQAFVPFE